MLANLLAGSALASYPTLCEALDQERRDGNNDNGADYRANDAASVELVASATTLRIKPRRPMLLGAVVVVPHAAPIILLALQLPWPTFVAAALVMGFGEMLFNTLWETTLQQHIPPASLSRVSAYDWFGSLPCEPLGLALAGVAAAAIEMSTTLWIAAAVDLAAVAAMLAAPSVWRLRRIDESQLKPSAQALAAG